VTLNNLGVPHIGYIIVRNHALVRNNAKLKYGNINLKGRPFLILMFDINN